MKRLCSTVLVMEAIIIGLAIPVAIRIDHLTPHTAGLTGGIAAVAAIGLALLARWSLQLMLVLGSLLQVYLIAAGQIVPVMYALGAIFAAFWIIGIVLGRRVERAAGH